MGSSVECLCVPGTVLSKARSHICFTTSSPTYSAMTQFLEDTSFSLHLQHPAQGLKQEVLRSG